MSVKYSSVQFKKYGTIVWAILFASILHCSQGDKQDLSEIFDSNQMPNLSELSLSSGVEFAKAQEMFKQLQNGQLSSQNKKKITVSNQSSQSFSSAKHKNKVVENFNGNNELLSQKIFKDNQLIARSKPKKKEATEEQYQLKEKMLGLLTKALGPQYDQPLLRWNPETKNLEEVHPDPEALASRQAIEEALKAMNARKFSVKKLKGILERNEQQTEHLAEANAKEQGEVVEPEVSIEQLPTSEAKPRYKPSEILAKIVAQKTLQPPSPPQNNDELTEDQKVENILQQPDVDIEIVDCEDTDNMHPKQEDVIGRKYLPSKIVVTDKIKRKFMIPEAEMIGDKSSDELNEQQKEIARINTVKSELNDRLSKISASLHFEDDVLSNMVNIDDAHLSPLEATFKRFILCHLNSDNCQHPSA